MSWIQLSLDIAEDQAEIAGDLFAETGAVSVTFEDAEDEPLFQIGTDDAGLWQTVKVVGMYAADINVDSVEQTLSSQLEGAGSFNWQREQLDEQVWELAWKDHFKPMQFGERFWIVPNDFSPTDELENAVYLHMDPGLAFGTGTHPTTALCLTWLEGQDLSGKTVIDFGCGSGVLAIAAVLLGAECVWAVDIDPCAIDATMENAESNGIADKIFAFALDDFEAPAADIVVANILANPLLELKSTLTDLAKPDAAILLSGILSPQADQVLAAYDAFSFSEPDELDDWVCLSGRKK